MFLMKNEVGNIYKKVSTESKKKELESLGYSVVSGEASIPEPAPKMLDDTSGGNGGMEDPQSANSGDTGAQGDGETEKSLLENLKKMKKDELIKYAEENEIDLSSAKSNKEIISAILKASEPKTVE